jgi:hypothetical protein
MQAVRGQTLGRSQSKTRSRRDVSVKAGGDDDLPPELQTSDDDGGKFAKIDQGDPAYGPPVRGHFFLLTAYKRVRSCVA